MHPRMRFTQSIHGLKSHLLQGLSCLRVSAQSCASSCELVLYDPRSWHIYKSIASCIPRLQLGGDLTTHSNTMASQCPLIHSGGARRAQTGGYLPIEDYGMIGNMHTCALVGMDGSVDFMCW